MGEYVFMQNIFNDEFWMQNFQKNMGGGVVVEQACQAISSASEPQIKDLKSKWEKNPFLFLLCNNKILDELKNIGIDIVVDQDDQNKIFAITEDGLMKQYDEIFRSSKSYFDSVTGDGYCQTYATVKAFDLGKITQAEAKKIRQEVAEASVCKYLEQISKLIGYKIKNFDDIPKELIYDDKYYQYFGAYKELMGLGPRAPWARSSLIMKYFSEKYKRPAFDIGISYFDEDLKDIAGITFYVYNSDSIQDILCGCPVVCLNGGAHNHAINLKADRAERKKFVLEFHNLFRDAYINLVFSGGLGFFECSGYDSHGEAILKGINTGSSIFKDNFYKIFMFGLLSWLFKKIDKQEVIIQLENFFNEVPLNYKNMVATKLTLCVFDKYKSIILEPFDINMPEDQFSTANKFLSDVLDDLKKDLSIKYPDLEKIFNHESKEENKPEENKPEPEKPCEFEKISDNPDPEPKPMPTTVIKSETTEPKKYEQIDKPKEDIKKDNGEKKTKSKPWRKPYNGSKQLFIFWCIITIGFFLLFYSAPEVKELPPKKDDKNETQNKSGSEESKTNEIDELSKLKSDPEIKPLSNLSNLNSPNNNQFGNESKKINHDQHEH